MTGKVKCVLVVLVLMALALPAAAGEGDTIHRQFMAATSDAERAALVTRYIGNLEMNGDKYERQLCRNELLLVDPKEAGGLKATCPDVMKGVRKNLKDAKDRAEGYPNIGTSEFRKARSREDRSREDGRIYLRLTPPPPWQGGRLEPRLTFKYVHEGLALTPRVTLNGKSLNSAFREGITLRLQMLRGSEGGGSCFVAGTLVLMADGSFKPIQDVVVGDRVRTRDVRTGEDMTAEVYELLSGREQAVYRFDDGLRVNAAHQFYTDKGAVKAGNLKPGAVLIGLEGPRTLCSIERQGPALASTGTSVPSIPVYNIMVRGTHTFFVSPDGHNTYMVLDISACGK